MNMKKRVAFILTIMLCFSLIPDVQAAKKQSLDSSVKSFMNAVKQMEYDSIEPYVKDWDDNSLIKDLHIMPHLEKQIKKANKKMTYKVLRKKVNGKTAQVTLKLKYKDLSEFATSMFATELTDMIWTNIDPDSLSEEEYMEYVDTLAESAEDYKTPFKTRKVTLTFVKDGKKWKLKRMTEALENVFTDNFLENFA